jgi:hypothetical protein
VVAPLRQALLRVLHFYNIPVTANISSPSSPTSIIKEVFRPGDFVAIKLDIDNAVGLPSAALGFYFTVYIQNPKTKGCYSRGFSPQFCPAQSMWGLPLS